MTSTNKIALPDPVSFSALFAERGEDEIAVVTEDCEYDVKTLLQLAGQLRESWVRSPYPAIASGRSTIEFIVALLAFDGTAEEIFVESDGELDGEGLSSSASSAHRLNGDRTTWLIATSGTTTGIPKRIRHTLKTLTWATKLDRAKGASYRWGLLYDPARFAGLQVILQALLGGGTLVVPGARGELGAVIDFFVEEGVNSLSATPTMWRRLFMTSNISDLALDQVTLGGEIADAGILAAVRARFPKARVVHIYASTEAGVGFAVSDGLPGFPATFLEPGELPGISLRISTEGRLLVKKHASSCGVAVTDGFLDTGDIVQLDGIRVQFLGRASGLINVGGNKVPPELVESVLLTHPDVVAAYVYPRTSSQMGSLVAADIRLTPKSDQGRARSELMKLCRDKLSQWQRPVALRFVDDIEMNSVGKVIRTGSQVK